MIGSRALAFMGEELKEVLPPTIFFVIIELSALLGEGELVRIIFTRGQSQTKPARR